MLRLHGAQCTHTRDHI